MPLLPDWLRWVWVIALAVVLVLHMRHVASMSGWARFWHIGHTVMAAGMIVMYLVRQQGHQGLYWAGFVLFGTLAVVMASASVVLWRRDRLLNWLWAASTVDMVVMAYMSLPNSDRNAVLTYILVAYLALEVVVWLSDPLPRVLAHQVHSLLRPGDRPPATDAPASRDGATMTKAPAARPHDACEEMRLVADVDLGVRVTLAIMSASMAWMLIAMQNMHMVVLMPMGGMHG